MSSNLRKKLNLGAFYIGLTIFVLITMFPFIWILITSLKSTEELYQRPPTWVPSFDFSSYVEIFTIRPFHIYLMNSFIVAIASTFFVVIFASLCGYAIARLKMKFKSIFLALVLAVSMFPTISVLSPIYIMLRDAGLLNTYTGLILPYITFGLPLAIFILSAFFREIPKELEESAAMDGCTKIGTFFKIILPLAVPGIFTTAILVFITSWNEFMFALTLMPNDRMRTVPVGIAMFPGDYELPWGQISAATVVVTIPIVLIVLLFQKKIISGITSGAVKG
ncbi:carbohydrate ABC transporter permease [Alkalibacterium psychrotolerans]